MKTRLLLLFLTLTSLTMAATPRSKPKARVSYEQFVQHAAQQSDLVAQKREAAKLKAARLKAEKLKDSPVKSPK